MRANPQKGNDRHYDEWNLDSSQQNLQIWNVGKKKKKELGGSRKKKQDLIKRKTLVKNSSLIQVQPS